MASVTITKTIGSTGNFSTPQLWEDGAPADLTTAEKSAATTFLTAAFIQGEALTFVGSGATGKLVDTDSTGAGTGTYITYGVISGNPAALDVVTGGTSGATCVLSSSTPTNVGVIWQGKVQNQEFAGAGTQLTLSGSSTQSDAYKELTTVAGASFRDHPNAQTSPLRYNASVGAGLRSTDGSLCASVGEVFSRVSNLQFSSIGTDGRAFSGTASTGLYENIICEGAYTGTTTSFGVAAFLFAFAATITIRNSIFIQRASAADHIVGLGSVTAIPSFFNCTFVAPDDLAVAPTSIFLGGGGTTYTFQNCGLFAGDSTKAIKAGIGTYVFTTCYSDISGTTGVTQTTYSNEFKNVTNLDHDFRLKSGAAQIDTGTTDATNAANDIVGTARPSGSAYDVGAWEYVAVVWPPPGSDDAPETLRASQTNLRW